MIAFLHPWALVGLAAAAVPILLHLLARREPPTVLFPAVRYLVTATREHHRRLKLQNWLLLLLRTALVIILVLAAAAPTAAPTAALGGVPGHAPAALVLILDNSPSSGVVTGGVPRLAQLRTAARRVLARAAPADALWLVAADGVPRRGDAAGLGGQLDPLGVSARRLDLGAAVASAGEILASEGRPGEIVVVSDLQATAVSPVRVRASLTALRPGAPPPDNAGLARVETGAQPWSTEGGRVTIATIADSGPVPGRRALLPLSVRLGDRPGRQALVAANGAVAVSLPGTGAGWWPLTAELDADELRADDRRVGAVRVAPLARISCDSAGRYAAAACGVLIANRRAVRGEEVTVGRLGRGVSVVQPPADPAAVGALNRALAARGVGWTYGALTLDAGVSDSGALVGRHRVFRRYRLQPAGSGRTGVLATASGSPWIARGNGVVLLGSRLDPAWTELPLSAGFMPFMDVLLNRVARGELALTAGAPGDPVPLPDLVTSVHSGRREWRVEGGGAFRPPDTGVYYLLAGHDTVGAVAANLDPRESRLEPASDAELGRLWPGVRILDLADAGRAGFATAARGDLRGPLLWAALIVGLTEVAAASAWRRTR